MDQQPTASRPYVEGYGIPEDPKGMLEWSFVTERMAKAMTYYVGSVRPDGRPHLVPVMGAWLDGRFFHGGGPQTRKARNLASNPEIVVHPDAGEDVVIIEGRAVEITDPALIERIDDAYEAKYNFRHGPHLWELLPRAAFAWTNDAFITTATRWTFDRSG